MGSPSVVSPFVDEVEAKNRKKRGRGLPTCVVCFHQNPLDAVMDDITGNEPPVQRWTPPLRARSSQNIGGLLLLGDDD